MTWPTVTLLEFVVVVGLDFVLTVDEERETDGFLVFVVDFVAGFVVDFVVGFVAEVFFLLLAGSAVDWTGGALRFLNTEGIFW